jgi:hypothetical protein
VARWLAVAALVLTMAVGAEAQAQVCGDADGDGAVTVNDGVLVLRAAAFLSSSCTPALCDIDVSGDITVADGVIVLRKAAALPITENCVTPQGTPSAPVVLIVELLQGLFSEALPIVVTQRAQPSPGERSCDNRADDGVFEVTTDDGIIIDFSGCELTNVLLDGSIETAEGNPSILLDLTDPVTDEFISIEGTPRGNDTDGGTSFDGILDASPSFDDDTTDFTVELIDLEVTAAGTILGGRVRIEGGEIPDVSQIEEIYDGSNLVTVILTTNSGTGTETYLFDLRTRRFIF